MQDSPAYDKVLAAHERIRPYIHRTPVMTSVSLNRIFGRELFFKCENFQKVGAFKYRGATNAILKLDKEVLSRGLATHSSGNHAAALAMAAKMQGVPAYIVMPENAPQVKKEAVKGYGAVITYCKPTLKAREEELEKIVGETGATFIHPFDNEDVVCGQATAAKELLEEQPSLDVVIAPVGGGGLLSGTSISVKALNKSCAVIGAEPLGADDAWNSFYGDRLVPQLDPQTIADGLLTSLSELTYGIIKEKVDDIYRVSEESIQEAMKLIWTRMKIIVEPSSAVALAVLLEHSSSVPGDRTGIIISGGNVDLSSLKALF